MNRRYVLKNRKRFYMFVMTISVIVFVIVFAAAANGADFEEYETVVVEKGDTLWDLAEKYCQGKDIRQYIEIIRSVNNLSDNTIYEGDVLMMPVSRS